MPALPAADEVDDFVAIAGRNFRLTPFLARQNLHVAFDRYAAVFEAEFTKKIDDCGASRCGAGFSVYLDCGFHRVFPELACSWSFRLRTQRETQMALRVAR